MITGYRAGMSVPSLQVGFGGLRDQYSEEEIAAAREQAIKNRESPGRNYSKYLPKKNAESGSQQEEPKRRGWFGRAKERVEEKVTDLGTDLVHDSLPELVDLGDKVFEQVKKLGNQEDKIYDYYVNAIAAQSRMKINDTIRLQARRATVRQLDDPNCKSAQEAKRLKQILDEKYGD